MAKKAKGNKPDQKGRRKGEGQFLPLHYFMAHHEAFQSLSGPAVKVWIELRCRYNTHNNGQLSLSFQQAADTLHLSKSSVARAYKELIEKGFIKLRRPGQWYGRLAAEYITTDCPLDGHPATNDWQKWRLPKTPKKQKSVPTRNTKRGDGAARVPSESSRCRESTRRPDLKVIDGAA